MLTMIQNIALQSILDKIQEHADLSATEIYDVMSFNSQNSGFTAEQVEEFMFGCDA